jgi:hypothetical protein
MSRPNFSLDDFKKWMKDHGDLSVNNFERRSVEGTLVESKISNRKLAEKIIIEEGELYDIVIDFQENGGTVVEVNDRNLLVRVATGLFYIPRKYVVRD